MNDVFDLIPSKTMRTALEEEKHVFTDSERASIIFHCCRDFEERNKRLKRIIDTTQDKKLISEIKNRFDEDDKFFKIFKENDGDYVYWVEIFEKDGAETGYKAVFAEYNEAFSVCLNFINQEKEFGNFLFRIEKHLLCSQEKLLDKERFISEIGSVSFSENCKPCFYWMKGGFCSENFDTNDTFESQYIFLPNPFEFGDRVKVIHNTELPLEKENKEWYVASTKKGWYEEQEKIRNNEYIKNRIDWTDVCITINFGNMDTDYPANHEHINPFYLEKI